MCDMEMLPECKVHFEEGTRRMDELHVKFDKLDAYLRNGVTSRLARHGAMINVIWPVLLLVLFGMVGVAWKSFGG